MDFKEYDSPETNSNYYNDYELDEFEEADDNESEVGTWDEDGLDFDLNINFDLRVSENVDQHVPVGQLCPFSATRRLSSSSETLRSGSSQSQQPISSLREPEFCVPEFCELFGYEPTFFGSQKFGSQNSGSQKFGSQKFRSQKIWVTENLEFFYGSHFS